jgi:hypothetical protein
MVSTVKDMSRLVALDAPARRIIAFVKARQRARTLADRVEKNATDEVSVLPDRGATTSRDALFQGFLSDRRGLLAVVKYEDGEISVVPIARITCAAKLSSW